MASSPRGGRQRCSRNVCRQFVSYGREKSSSSCSARFPALPRTSSAAACKRCRRAPERFRLGQAAAAVHTVEEGGQLQQFGVRLEILAIQDLCGGRREGCRDRFAFRFRRAIRLRLPSIAPGWVAAWRRSGPRVTAADSQEPLRSTGGSRSLKTYWWTIAALHLPVVGGNPRAERPRRAESCVSHRRNPRNPAASPATIAPRPGHWPDASTASRHLSARRGVIGSPAARVSSPRTM